MCFISPNNLLFICAVIKYIILISYEMMDEWMNDVGSVITKTELGGEREAGSFHRPTEYHIYWRLKETPAPRPN